MISNFIELLSHFWSNVPEDFSLCIFVSITRYTATSFGSGQSHRVMLVGKRIGRQTSRSSNVSKEKSPNYSFTN